MAKIKSFDRASAREVTNAIIAALAAVEKKYGVKVSANGGSYRDNELTARFSITTVAADGTTGTDKNEADYFRMMAAMWGLKPSHLGKSFPFNGGTYKVLGAVTRRRVKYNVICMNKTTGKKVRIMHTSVANAFASR